MIDCLERLVNSINQSCLVQQLLEIILFSINPQEETTKHMSFSHTLPHEFQTLSQENTRLNRNLISITLNHEQLLEQNRQLSEQLKKQQYALIESTLREKNLDHTLKNLQQQYDQLQDQYQEVYNMATTAKRFEIRDVYKKESQLAFDLANIERESYREAKAAKNQQINQYQERMIHLAKQNDSLKIKMLQMTSEYNTKLYELKSPNIQNQTKLNALKALDTKNQEESFINFSNDLQMLQLQLKLQNTKEKLEFYMKQNFEIKSRNSKLSEQVDRLLSELKEMEQSETKVEKDEGQLWRVLNKEESSVEYITGVVEENSKLRKEIEEMSEKYILLTEKYPKLVEEFDTIRELQENMTKLTQRNNLKTQLSTSQQKCTSLQASLESLQAKYLSQLKTRQSVQYKTSILTKRFNQMFIRMNPYFDIYQYEALELDEAMWEFFDQNKDYKQVKEYEAKVLGMKREVKEAQANFQARERQLNLRIQEKQSDIARLIIQKQQIRNHKNQLSDANHLLKDQLNNYQLSLNSIQDQTQTPLSLKHLQHQVSLPLLQSMVEKLHLERQQLFKTIALKDKTIAQLSQQLHSTKLHQPTKTINLTSQPPQNSLQLPSLSIHFEELLQQNNQLEVKYEKTIHKLTQQIQTLQQQLHQQHDMYQMEVHKYEHQHQNKLIEVKKNLDQWIASTEELRVKLQLHEQQKPHDNSQMHAQNQVQNALNPQQGEMLDENPPLNQSHQQIPQNTHLSRQPSHTNLQKLPLITNEQPSNKLIGESTVQTLTQTLKKYESDMQQVLTMCAKLSKDYSDLKQKARNHEELQTKNLQLTKECNYLKEQLHQTTTHLQQKNIAISTLQTLFNAKSAHCDQLTTNSQQQHSLLSTQLTQSQSINQTLANELQQLKDKFYQLAAKPSAPEDVSLMNKNEFETIVIMQANKNRELSNLADKNKNLETKLQFMMQELNELKLKGAQKKAQEVSPLERAEMKQLTSLLQGTNVMELVKRANQIIESQAAKEKQAQQEQQKQGIEEAAEAADVAEVAEGEEGEQIEAIIEN